MGTRPVSKADGRIGYRPPFESYELLVQIFINGDPTPISLGCVPLRVARSMREERVASLWWFFDFYQLSNAITHIHHGDDLLPTGHLTKAFSVNTGNDSDMDTARRNANLW